VEEAHEAAASVRAGDVKEALDELGDVLFMAFFLIHLYEEQGDFRLEEVCDRICEKMIRRHPHVFGDSTVHSSQEVRSNWERIKANEKVVKGESSNRVPESLPALMRAYRILSRLSHQDPLWNDTKSQTQKFALKSQKLCEFLASDSSTSPEIFGELLLILVNLARMKHYRAEDCLHEQLRSMEPSS
jgi:uncharacterized protein YabN with tetrapyrrole methylase and pyrophosphatase domain